MKSLLQDEERWGKAEERESHHQKSVEGRNVKEREESHKKEKGEERGILDPLPFDLHTVGVSKKG